MVIVIEQFTSILAHTKLLMKPKINFVVIYENSEIKTFGNGIKRDITPVKNVISYSESSRFVESNNNKFKLLKRIVYGRSNLINLEKKCKLAFLQNLDENKQTTLCHLLIFFIAYT